MSKRAATAASACGRIAFLEPPNPTHHASPYFSRAVVVNGVVHVSGTGAGNHPDGTPRRGTAAEEAKWAYENVTHVLRQAGTSWDHVFRVTMLISEKHFYDACNRAYLECLPDPNCPPMRTTTLWGVPTDMKVGFACEALLPQPPAPGAAPAWTSKL